MKPQKSKQKNNLNFQIIPPIHDILRDPSLNQLRIEDRYLKYIIDDIVTDYRDKIQHGKLLGQWNRSSLKDKIVTDVHKRVERLRSFRLKRVINGTGIILHTNLGRAPFAETAKKHLQNTIENYCNLEINLTTGERGNRISLVEEIICMITGAEATVVVNNNAAAVLLTLNSLCYKREVPVSRGELVEIGGSFRMPEVMKASGVKMVEVGTTNKTHLSDYIEALSPRTGGILKVHTSNYRILGFTDSVSISELVSLSQNNNIPLLYDMGSGVIENLENWGYPHEPVAREYVDAGVDVITFSADKVLGGPQAGIIIGKKEYVKKIKKNHLLRALRCDKLTFALLDATLRLYVNPDDLNNQLPVAHMLTLTKEQLYSRGMEIKNVLEGLPLDVEVVESYSQMGGGALPLEKIPSVSIKIIPHSLSVSKFAKKLRLGDQSIIGYISDDSFFINLRTVRKDEIPQLIKGIKQSLS